ncbi:hypothetical protein WDZ92_54270, partial [Nostoc sp. NIES-2111]
PDSNSGPNAATAVVGNGAFNAVGGSVTANADQHIGDHGFGGWDFGPDVNQGTNAATVLAGNGVGNLILGNVTADAHQDIGDTGFHLPFIF